MYVILIYDIPVKNNNKLHKYLKQKLNWIQNSVFEWEITKSQFLEIEIKIKSIIWKENEWSVIIFNMPYKTWFIDKKIYWIEKNKITSFI